jgi:hypothetical protein
MAFQTKSLESNANAEMSNDTASGLDSSELQPPCQIHIIILLGRTGRNRSLAIFTCERFGLINVRVQD